MVHGRALAPVIAEHAAIHQPRVQEIAGAKAQILLDARDELELEIGNALLLLHA